jgi:purine-nucleoside phosphorylase
MGPRFAALADICRRSPPDVVVVLGSGLGAAAGRVRAAHAAPFAEVPGLPAAAVAGHRGVVTLGEWAGHRVLVFEGRVHYYEGHSWDAAARPVRTAAALGARVAVLTCAAGGIADDLDPGSLMAVRRHIDWTRPYAWRPDPPRPAPYSPRLLGLLARAAGGAVREGVYAQVTGPCYETPAEVRALRACGADAVGMSAAREAEAAAAAGLECAAVALVANRAAGLAAAPPAHAEVLAAAAAAAGRLAELVERFLLLL